MGVYTRYSDAHSDRVLPAGSAGSAGAILALSRTVKFLFEPVVTWVPGDGAATDTLWSAGLRIGHEHWALDLGFTYLGPTSGDSWPILPLIFFPWRTQRLGCGSPSGVTGVRFRAARPRHPCRSRRA